MSLSRSEILAGVLALLIAAGCVRLGVWQLDRLEQQQTRNAALERGLALPPLVLNTPHADSLARIPGAYVNRRAHVRGVYDAVNEIILRGRSLNGRPGVHLVTPLRIAGVDAAVLVDRGWVAAPDAATPPARPAPEPGLQSVVGIMRDMPNTRAGSMPLTVTIDGAPTLSLQRLSPASLRNRFPYPVLPVVLQQLPAPALVEPPVRTPPPELSAGPHLGYAIQWFSFAAIAAGGWLILVLRGRGPLREV